MALRDVQDYVEARGKVSLQDLALHFGSSPEAMRDMAGLLVRKGRLQVELAKSACGACACKTGCMAAETYSPAPGG